jgi:hypothetical protein
MQHGDRANGEEMPQLNAMNRLFGFLSKSNVFGFVNFKKCSSGAISLKLPHDFSR